MGLSYLSVRLLLVDCGQHGLDTTEKKKKKKKNKHVLGDILR